MAEGGFCSDFGDEDLLYCSVCMEEFEDPRALPCLHTFCYKCLVQFSWKTTAAVELQASTKLSSYFSNILNISKPGEKLKCPVCAEEHDIPKDKGVAGFRKDFRVNKIIEKQRENAKAMKEAEEASLEERALSDGEMCSVHPDEKLRYYCENDTCKSDICEMCWINDHDKHRVTLLSKMMKDAKENVTRQMDINLEKITSHMNSLSQTTEAIAQQYDQVKHDLKQRYEDIKKKLQKEFDQSIEKLDVQRKTQMKKLSDKTEDMSALKDTVERVQQGLESKVMPRTSRTVKEYERSFDKMKECGAELENWSLDYTTAKLQEFDMETIVQIAVFVSYEELSSASAAAEEKGAKEEKKMESKSLEPEKIFPKTCPASSPTAETATAVDLKVLKRNSFDLKLMGSFKVKDKIDSLAESKDGKLYVTSESQLLCYTTNPFQQVSVRDLFVKTDAIAAIASKSDGHNFLVKLHSEVKTLSFLSLKGNSAFVHSLGRTPNGFLASSDHFVSFAYTVNGKVYVKILSLENSSMKITSYGDPVEIPFQDGKLRAMGLYTTSKGNPVIVCCNVFTTKTTKKSELAVTSSVLSRQVNHTKFTFTELDPNESQFDLCDVACGKDFVFILNRAGGVLYKISKIPQKSVQKVNIAGTGFPLSCARFLCADPERKKVYLTFYGQIVAEFRHS